MNGNVNITVTALMSVPDETAQRCMTLLEMWLDDNPDKNIVCDAIPCDDRTRHRFRIQTLKSEVKE